MNKQQTPFRTRYRIVHDRYLGFETQFRPWWCPWWFMCFGVNTSGTLERAREIARNHAQPVIENVDFSARSSSAEGEGNRT